MQSLGHIHTSVNILFFTRTQSDIASGDEEVGYNDDEDFPELSLHPSYPSPDNHPLVPASQVELHKDASTGETGSAPGSNVLH